MWIRALENEARNAQPGEERRGSFEASHLEVRMFNVGHGEAILVSFPGGRTWLVDGGNTNSPGPNAQLGRLLIGYMEQHGLTLEACVASHPHVDHCGALETILASGSAALAETVTVYRGEVAWHLDRRWLDRYHQVIADQGQAVEEVTLRNAHREVTIDDGIVAHLFAGSGDGPYTSLFMQLRYHSAQLLFTGDAHCNYEKDLLQAVGEADFRADVYKITHHGSSSGTPSSVVGAAAPAIVVASTGNDSGHRLEQDTLERVLGPDGGRRVFETLVDGDIIVQTDGQPYIGGVLYRVEFASPGQFAHDDDVMPADQIDRTRTDDPDCNGAAREISEAEIAEALVNPAGPEQGAETVTLRNTGPTDIALGGWTLRDRVGRRENLAGSVPAGHSITFTLNTARLANSGGTITLLDPQGSVVDHVTYTGSQGSRQGTPIIFHQN